MGSDSRTLPTIDFGPFCREGDEDGKTKVVERISKACSEFGFFQVVNHGIPIELMKQALEVYRSFFERSYEEKLKYVCKFGDGPAAGFFRSPDLSKEGSEQFLILHPHFGLNLYPKVVPDLQQVMEKIFPQFAKLASLSESLISQSMGLAPNHLKEYNNDRAWDFLLGLHYFPATGTENIGKPAHEDVNCLTLLYQDNVGGLQFCQGGQWIPVPPAEDKIIVSAGDVIRVLSNDKFKSSTHKVLRTKGKDRYSFAFSLNLTGDKWIEPLPEFTEEIGASPKYTGFAYNDYIQLRRRDRLHPPERSEDMTRVSHFAIATP